MKHDHQGADEFDYGAAILGHIGVRTMDARLPPRPALSPRIRDPEPLQDQMVEETSRGGILEYWRILRRHKVTLALLAAFGIVLGYCISLSQTRLYQAHASLEIEELAPDPSDMRVAEKSSDSGQSTALTDMPTQIKILQSESLIARALDRVKRDSSLQLPDRGTAGWRSVLRRSKPSTESKHDDDLVAKARANLTVRADGQTRILDVAFDSTDPKYAAAFANSLASEFIEQNIETRWNVSQRTAEWLTHELDEMRGKLEHSEVALQEYATKSGLTFTSDKSNVSDDKLRQFESALANAEMERIAKQSRYESVIAKKSAAGQDMFEDPTAREERSKLTDLMRQRADMATIYTADYVKVRELDAQIASVRAALEAESREIEEHARREYEEAVRREKLLAVNYHTQTTSMNREAEKAIQYNILKREVDSNQQLYDAMLQRTKLVNAAAALRTANVRILDSAKIPTAPYKPKPTVNALLGCCTGLLLGAVIIIARDRGNRTLQDRGDVNTYLNLPELGVIPLAARGCSLHALPYDFAVTESFRGAVTSILFSSRYGLRSPSQALVITSWSPGEGKSLTVCNLGVALAEIGRRVLIVDGDMRRPAIHRILKVENHVGLSDLLAGSESLTPDVPLAVVQDTEIQGLSVITSGPVPSNPSALLYSQRAKDSLDLLRRHYDAILIDTPPMQTITDARLFGAMADAVILVVRASSTSRDAAMAAKQRFVDDGTHVLGAILNCWDARYASKHHDYGDNSSRVRALNG